MSMSDKQATAARFGLSSCQCTFSRILIATDAYGLGIDNPDVERVVQWLLPSSMQKLYQRLGRAMRCGKGQAHFTLLYSPCSVGPRSGPAANDDDEVNQSNDQSNLDINQSKGKQIDAVRRQELAPGLWAIINVTSDDCIRKVGLEYFADEIYGTPAYVKPQPCCSGCDSSFQISITAHAALNKTQEKDSVRRPWLVAKLTDWREKKAQERFPNTYLRFYSSLIMPDTVLTTLATWAEYIHDEISMRRWVGNQWTGISRYKVEILQILMRGQAMRSDRGEIFDEWARYNDKKRRRVPAEEVNPERAEFEKRRASWLIERGHKPESGKAGRAARSQGGNKKKENSRPSKQ